MTKTEILQSLIQDRTALDSDIKSTPFLFRVIGKRQYQAKKNQLVALNNQISDMLTKDNYYKVKDEHISKLRSESEIEEIRRGSYELVFKYLDTIFNKGLDIQGVDVSFDYDIDINTVSKYPEGTEVSELFRVSLHIEAKMFNHKYTLISKDLFLSLEEIRELGYHLEIRELKHFGLDEEDFTGHVRYNSYNTGEVLALSKPMISTSNK